jgi:hypothetical protein
MKSCEEVRGLTSLLHRASLTEEIDVDASGSENTC